MKFKPDENLYIFSMGKRFRVTAIFTSDAEANAHMERDKDASCIASFGGPDDPRGTFVFIANKYDSSGEAAR